MNVIGITRTVPVRTIQVVNGKRKLVPKIGLNGEPETKSVAASVWRATRGTLDGSFGRDRNRRLIVGLIAGDVLALRPQGTHQLVTLPLADVYGIALQRRADRERMAVLRERKARKQELRERRNREARERRFHEQCRRDTCQSLAGIQL